MPASTTEVDLRSFLEVMTLCIQQRAARARLADDAHDVTGQSLQVACHRSFMGLVVGMSVEDLGLVLLGWAGMIVVRAYACL